MGRGLQRNSRIDLDVDGREFGLFNTDFLELRLVFLGASRAGNISLLNFNCEVQCRSGPTLDLFLAVEFVLYCFDPDWYKIGTAKTQSYG